MEANEDRDEVKLLLLILEQFRQRKLTLAANIQSKLQCLKERCDSYLGCKQCRVTQRISRSIFHKAKVFSGHLRVFLTSALFLPLTSLLFHHHNPRRWKK